MHAPYGGLSKLAATQSHVLDDFHDIFETEWRFLAALLLASLAFVGATTSALIIAVSPPSHVYLVHRVILWSSILTLFTATAYIIEPEPTRWRQLLASVRPAGLTQSMRERRARLRRWWRWRKKEAMKTTLNV